MIALTFLFTVFPYVAVALAVVVGCIRYFGRQYSHSSLSSQFLERKRLFWGSVPWHYGILVVLILHLAFFFFPKGILAWNGVPWRLYLLEGTGLAFGLLAGLGIILLLVRRLTDSRIKAVTSPLDILVLVLLLLQVGLGLYTAIAARWGSSWFASGLAPYLWSLVKFHPDATFVTTLPHAVKVHVINAFVLVALFPFTRLVHLLSIPFKYLLRPPQVVIWNSPRRKSDV